MNTIISGHRGCHRMNTIISGHRGCHRMNIIISGHRGCHRMNTIISGLRGLWNWSNPAIFYWSTWPKQEKWAVIYMCDIGINFVPFYYFKTEFWSCSDSTLVFPFFFYSNDISYFSWASTDASVNIFPSNCPNITVEYLSFFIYFSEGDLASEPWQQTYGKHSGNEIYHIQLCNSRIFKLVYLFQFPLRSLWNWSNPATFYWSTWPNKEKWAVIYMCDIGINFVPFYYFKTEFWSCSEVNLGSRLMVNILGTRSTIYSSVTVEYLDSLKEKYSLMHQ
jgi:hypothetical protein